MAVAPLTQADPLTDPGGAFNEAPVATLLLLILNIVGAIVLIIGKTDMTFEQYLTYGVAANAALGIGRGLAVKGDATVQETLLERFNALPWSQINVVFYTVVGAVVLLVGGSESLNFEHYMALVIGAAGALAIGKGIGQAKKDANPILTGNSDPAFQEHLDAAQAAIPDPGPPHNDLNDTEDDELGAPEVDEPDPPQAPRKRRG